jgi:hypothetical protein
MRFGSEVTRVQFWNQNFYFPLGARRIFPWHAIRPLGIPSKIFQVFLMDSAPTWPRKNSSTSD